MVTRHREEGLGRGEIQTSARRPLSAHSCEIGQKEEGDYPNEMISAGGGRCVELGVWRTGLVTPRTANLKNDNP